MPFLSSSERAELAAELAWILSELPPRPMPASVARYCRESGLDALQVRWCDWCEVVAPAIDHHQVSRLDAVGFDTLCPDCKCP